MTTRTFLRMICLVTLVSLGAGRSVRAGGESSAVALNADGEKHMATYAKMLEELRKEIAASLPAIDEQKKAAFLAARGALDQLKAPGEGATAGQMEEYRAKKAQAETNTLDAARAMLKDLDAFLGSDQLNAKLVQVAILANATPRGLAEFAQQGAEEKGLLDKLFADDALMKQMLVAGGANGAEYGEAMQTYTTILAASERARKPGILQRLALGTSLQQPWLKGKEKGGVYGTVYTDNTVPDGQVARYLAYEKAYLNGELDPAFKDMTTWDCRFITNDPYTNEELAWTRQMMRNYRPDHITNPDYKWRYARIVKSDVPYRTPDWRPDEGTTKVQQIVAGGGKCGPRAFFGRTAARAFGIPARRSTQRGHAAMNHWTPDGWIVCFGAWWSWNWCGPWGGLDFLLDSQARAHPEDYRKVLRAQWVGDALGEEEVSLRHYGQGGGLWNALAFYEKKAIVADAKVAADALQEKLASLTEKQATKLLGETDEAPGEKELNPMIQIPKEDRTVTTDPSGVITVPAAACVKPTNSTDRIIFMENLDGKTQVHYARLGKQPELLKYEVEVPKAGKYALTAHVVTVARNQQCLLRLNRRTLIDVDLPFSLGMWADTKPVPVDLKEGRNTLLFTCKVPNRGVSIRYFRLKPVK